MNNETLKIVKHSIFFIGFLDLIFRTIKEGELWATGNRLEHRGRMEAILSARAAIKELNQAPPGLQTNFPLKVMFNLNHTLPKGKRLVSSLG